MLGTGGLIGSMDRHPYPKYKDGTHFEWKGQMIGLSCGIFCIFVPRFRHIRKPTPEAVSNELERHQHVATCEL